MTLPEIHGRLASTALLYIIILTLWAIWSLIRRQDINSNYRGALVVAEVLLLTHGALGLFMFISRAGSLERGYIHILYGVISMLVIPGIFLYTREDEQRLSLLFYIAFLLALGGILVRAMMTGG